MSKNLVILNGNLCTDVMWKKLSAAFKPEFEIVLPDINQCLSIGDMAKRALGAVDGNFILLGYSMGGYAAFEILRQSPERVLAAAFVSTSARADTRTTSRRLCC